MKYVIVGSSHFGYEAVQTIAEADAEAEIHLYERGDKASFMSCGAQSYLEGIAESPMKFTMRMKIRIKNKALMFI